MYTLLLAFHVMLAIVLVVLVLLQQGKGADAGAAFGSGASATVFGARGSASFLTRATGIVATLFFVTSLVLATIAGRQVRAPKSVTEAVPVQTAPATDTIAPEAVPKGMDDVPVVTPGADKSSDVLHSPADVPAAAGDVPSVPGDVPATVPEPAKP